MDCVGKEPLATEMLKCLTDELHRSRTYLGISTFANIILSITVIVLLLF